MGLTTSILKDAQARGARRVNPSPPPFYKFNKFKSRNESGSRFSPTPSHNKPYLLFWNVESVMSSLKNGKYRHYKGNLYEVIDIARHSENLEEMVIYKALYGDFGLWVRPLKMFLEDVEIDGKIQKRFQLIS